MRIIAIVAAGLLLAGCASAHVSDANATVCRHYLAQRATIVDPAKPTLGDIKTFIVGVVADAALSTGTLHTDLQAMADGMAAGHSVSGPSTRVYVDCTGHQPDTLRDARQ